MTVKVGDLIRVIDADPVGDFRYKNGNMFYVSKVWKDGGGVDIDGWGTVSIELYNREFEVIPRNPHPEYFAEPMGNEVGAVNTSINGKLLRIYTATDVFGSMNTHITVGIDEVTGVMYVLGMKTEVVE